MRHALACCFVLGVGCSTSAAKAPARVPVVAIDDAPASRDAPEAVATTFSCRPARVGDSAEIVLSVRSVTEDSRASEDLGSRAAYRVRVLAVADGEVSRAEVTLEQLQPEVLIGRQQMAWHTAVARGWVKPGQPFEMARAGASAGWCFAEAGHCKDGDSAELQFVSGLGETVSLVKRPELEAQLEGKRNDGTLELELSPALRDRATLGVVDGETTRASQQGSKFPAMFRFGLRGSTPATKPSSEPELSAKLKIDRACRLRTLKTVLRRDRNDYEAVHELEWSITPSW